MKSSSGPDQPLLPDHLRRAADRLRFPADLEREFRVDYYQRYRGYARAQAALALVAMLVLGLEGLRLPPESRATFLLIRYGVLCPALGLLLGLTYSRLFPRLFEFIGGAGILCLGASWALGVALGASPPVPVSTVFVLLVLGAHTILRLRFLAATATSVLLFLIFRLLPVSGPADWMAVQGVPLVVAGFFGMIGSYSSERMARREFLLHRLLSQERQRSEELLLNILPGPVAERLKRDRSALADQFAEVTVLFADLVDFTTHAAALPPRELVSLLNEVFTAFDDLAERHGLEKVKTIGDAYMVAGGVPEPHPRHAEAVADMALGMLSAAEELERRLAVPLRLRIGINSGPVVAGVVGRKKFIYDLWGDAVNLASRMESQGVAGRIQVTEATARLLGESYMLECRGSIEVRGRGSMTTYFLLGRRQPLGEDAGRTGAPLATPGSRSGPAS